MSEITFRFATGEDMQLLIHHRSAMFAEMNVGHKAGRTVMEPAFATWAARKMAEGSYVSWLACAGEEVVAGLGMLVLDWPPGPDGDQAPRAYLYNVYTEPAYRQRGIARQLVTIAIDECRARGITKIGLHASTAGRPIYEKLGFIPTNEMRLVL